MLPSTSTAANKRLQKKLWENHHQRAQLLIKDYEKAMD